MSVPTARMEPRTSTSCGGKKEPGQGCKQASRRAWIQETACDAAQQQREQGPLLLLPRTCIKLDEASAGFRSCGAAAGLELYRSGVHDGNAVLARRALPRLPLPPRLLPSLLGLLLPSCSASTLGALHTLLLRALGECWGEGRGGVGGADCTRVLRKDEVWGLRCQPVVVHLKGLLLPRLQLLHLEVGVRYGVPKTSPKVQAKEQRTI